jgi:hypothetical protein
MPAKDHDVPMQHGIARPFDNSTRNPPTIAKVMGRTAAESTELRLD